MDVVFVLSIFWIGYGIAGLFGFQVIPTKYKGKEWTKRCIRQQGISWLLVGIPWFILWWIDSIQAFSAEVGTILLIVCAIPAIIYTIVIDKKYRALLKDE